MPHFHHREIIDEVAGLYLPRPDRVVINHGGAMVARGYRPERLGGDIDMCIDDELNLGYLEHILGFVVVRKVVGTSSDGSDISIDVRHEPQRSRFDIHRWDFSQYRYNRTGKGRISLNEQISMSDQDHETGLWIASDRLLLLEKLQTGRPQDDEDVARIGDYHVNGY